MKDEYDLSKMKGAPNPYAKQLKNQTTIRVDIDVADYFIALSDELDVPFEKLINMCLRDCIAHRRKSSVSKQQLQEQQKIVESFGKLNWEGDLDASRRDE